GRPVVIVDLAETVTHLSGGVDLGTLAELSDDLVARSRAGAHVEQVGGHGHRADGVLLDLTAIATLGFRGTLFGTGRVDHRQAQNDADDDERSLRITPHANAPCPPQPNLRAG